VSRLANLGRALLAASLLLASFAAPLPAHAASPPVRAVPRVAALPPLIAGSGSWTTYHHDNARTGLDPTAPTAVSGSINPTPGWNEPALDEQVYAEPLIYNSLVYVATLNNTIYALSQFDGSVVWSRHLGTAQGSGWVCGDVSPQGIIGTPVIDTATNRIFAAALISGHTPTYHLFGLDLTTGAVVFNRIVSPAGFDWKIQQERGALALANGYVYIPIGGRAGDCFDSGIPYYGYVVGVPTAGNAPNHVFRTASGAESVWAAGGVLVDNTSHNVFFATGNAIPCDGVAMSDSVVRVSPTLTSPTLFQPDDWHDNWCAPDQDLGSASPVLISPTLMFTAGKHGGGFLLNPANLGGQDGQLYPTPKPAIYSQADVCFGNTSDATFGSFAYAAPFVYVECEMPSGGLGLVALNVNTATPSFSPCDALCASPDWNTGGTTTYGPPIVAGGAVWAASDGGGLAAFDATTGAQIYQSAGFGINRFSTPAEAGGQVFVAADNVVMSFTFATPAPVAYTAVTPARQLDTRSTGGPLGPGEVRNFTLTGPAANATSVVMNVTATNTTAAGFLTVYASGSPRPLASNLNWTSGRTVANLVEVPVSAGGGVSLYNSSGSTNVIADLEGYFSAPSGTAGQEVALTPARITDTRSGSGQPNAGMTLGPAGQLDIQVTGAGGVPATGASAVILNVTATHTTASSFLTVWPTGTTLPTASNLNWVAGQTVPNRVIVPIGTGGKVSVYNASGAADVIVDVSGYFTDGTATGTLFNPQVPYRIADTRSSAPIGSGGTYTLTVGGSFGVPSTATAVILNVTVTHTTAAGFLTVFPSTSTRPNASDLNWPAGLTVPNLVVATLGTTGAISFYNSAGSTDVIVDLVGYFN
jgi:hypothetical protein